MRKPSRLVRCIVLLVAIALLASAIVLPKLATILVIAGCSLLFVGMVACLLPSDRQAVAGSSKRDTED